MTDPQPARRKRRWIVPALLLGAGAWVVVARRSAAEADEGWAPRPPVERAVVPPPAPAAATPPATPPAAPAAPAAPTPAAAPPAAVRPLTSAVPPTASASAEPGPHGPGSAAPRPDGSAPSPEFTIKGNAGSRLFHPPSSPYYRRTKAEVWFRTAEDAAAAGFTAYTPRRRTSS